MARSKTYKRSYKGVEYALNRSELDFDPWSIEGDTWRISGISLKREAVRLAEFAIEKELAA